MAHGLARLRVVLQPVQSFPGCDVYRIRVGLAEDGQGVFAVVLAEFLSGSQGDRFDGVLARLLAVTGQV